MTAPPASTADHAAVERLVKASGSSFYWPMRLSPGPQQKALFAIYAFCRHLDAIADGGEPPEERARLLFEWRRHIGMLFIARMPELEGDAAAIAATLREAIAAFSLPREPFDAVLDGLEQDVAEEMRGPVMATLSRYCDCVAGAVGRLCLAVFGWRGPDADAFADALGAAVQLTNILRDVEEDAHLGRLYVPREALDAAGIVASDPGIVLADRKFADAWLAIAGLAEARFHHAESLLPPERRTQARMAVAMLKIYRALLQRLRRRGWRPGAPRMSVPRLAAMAIALRVMLSGR